MQNSLLLSVNFPIEHALDNLSFVSEPWELICVLLKHVEPQEEASICCLRRVLRTKMVLAPKWCEALSVSEKNDVRGFQKVCGLLGAC